MTLVNLIHEDAEIFVRQSVLDSWPGLLMLGRRNPLLPQLFALHRQHKLIPGGSRAANLVADLQHPEIDESGLLLRYGPEDLLEIIQHFLLAPGIDRQIAVE